MKNPKTIYEVLELLRDLHKRNLDGYRTRSESGSTPQTKILLEFLAKEEKLALNLVLQELNELDPKHCTFLTSGPTLSSSAMNSESCHCSSTPSFDEALDCAFEPDPLLNELLQRLEATSAAPSVIALAKRLREMEESKGRHISSFTRLD